jgi:hypothetical protein
VAGLKEEAPDPLLKDRWVPTVNVLEQIHRPMGKSSKEFAVDQLEFNDGELPFFIADHINDFDPNDLDTALV